MRRIINGIAGPALTRKILTADENTRELLQLVLMNNTLLNQAFTKVFVAASSLAIIFWSVDLMRAGKLARIVAAIGCLLGSISLLLLFSGHLQLNVHGFGLLIFGQTVWTMLIGIYLLRLSDPDKGFIDNSITV